MAAMNHWRSRFGKKNKSLSAVQLSLFEKSVLVDIVAVDTEIEQIKPAVKTAPAKPLPHHLPRIEHRHEPEFCQCGPCGTHWLKSVRTSP
ncbi:MAG: hypothetical protein MRK00_12170 [Nitrosomonas sp.]|nr:hypothetical protein [Nitrosomonas sp.]